MSDNTIIIRLPEVLRTTGLSRSLIYQYVKEEKFPKPVKLGERASGWLLKEVQAWIAARVAERQG